MSNVRNQASTKVVTFTGEVQRPGFCGVVSSITWDNPSVQAGLRAMFGCKADEVIVAVEVTDQGIKAKFEHLSNVRGKR